MLAGLPVWSKRGRRRNIPDRTAEQRSDFLMPFWAPEERTVCGSKQDMLGTLQVRRTWKETSGSNAVPAGTHPESLKAAFS